MINGDLEGELKDSSSNSFGIGRARVSVIWMHRKASMLKTLSIAAKRSRR